MANTDSTYPKLSFDAYLGVRRLVNMTAAENKKLLQDIFEQLALGNTRAMSEAMAEDCRWGLPRQLVMDGYLGTEISCAQWPAATADGAVQRLSQRGRPHSR